MASSHHVLVLLFLIVALFAAVFCVPYPVETDTIYPGQMLRDWEQLVSAGGVFRLGFFTPRKASSFELGSAGPRYIGIWFDRIPFNPVWVGNPMNPVMDSSGALTVGTNGVLKITQPKGSPPITVNPKLQLSLAGNVSATLLDSGNFVIRDVGAGGIPGRVLWQSFDYPGNVLLPGMKIGFNLKTGKEVSVKSWISDQVLTPGAFRLGLDPSGADQLLIWRRNEVYWSSGIWKSENFRLSLNLSKEYIGYEFNFHSDKYERYFTYSIKDTNLSVLSRWELDTLGQVSVNTVVNGNGSSSWIFESSGTCSTDLKNGSAICISEKPTACRKGSEYFEQKRGYMLQELGQNDLSYYDSNPSLDLSDCHASCWRNCSCVAFQTFSGGIGCQFWPKGSKFVPDDMPDQFTYVLKSAK